MRMPTATKRVYPGPLFALLLAAGCGGDGGPAEPPPPPPVATTLTAGSSINVAGVVGQPVAEQPTVLVRDQRGNPMPGIAVAFTVQSGGGSVTGATATTSTAGIAAVGSWTLGTAAGPNTLSATVGALTPVTFSAVAAAGPAAGIARIAATDEQAAQVGTPVSDPPAVTVSDVFGNPVQGVAVTFAVTGGGGTITGADATSDAAGSAAVGSWTLGAEAGLNTLTATAAGLAGSPATFTATATVEPTIDIVAITPALLAPGGTATITGSGFSATPAQNEVTIAGLAATVTAATATQLTVTVPTALPCEPTREVPVTVTRGANHAARQHPLRVATLRTLAAGESLVLGDLASVRCNELDNTGGRYVISVYNTNRTYTSTAASFQLRGSAATAAPLALFGGTARPDVGGRFARAARTAAAPRMSTDAVASPRMTSRAPAETEADRLHHYILEENIRYAERHRHEVAAMAAPPDGGAVAADVKVGDILEIRIPNVSSGNFCQNFFAIDARVAYVGTRSIVLDDVANPLAGQIDSTYASIGQEFDAVMFDLIADNFGDPLAMDAATANNGKVVMVFSNTVNTNMPGIAGFVVTCDFLPRSPGGSSNFGQYFYAIVPTVNGDFATAGSPPRWRWTMRPTVLHEAKHIASFAERWSRNASMFEESWLEESTARMAEELYERARYGFAQRANIGYGSAADPVGPYCGVRTSCVLANDQPRGFVRAFEDLTINFFPFTGTRSPLGRLNSNDFSFYNTGWSLVRWMIDHGPLSESEFLRALTQSATHAGLGSLELRTGRSFADMLPEWLLAMALDDRPGFTAAHPRLNQPSWNLRSVLAGLNADFPQNYPSPFPLAAAQTTYGEFVHSGMAVPGTGSFIELSGTQAATQLIELRAAAGVAAPAELRLAIVRIQ